MVSFTVFRLDRHCVGTVSLICEDYAKAKRGCCGLVRLIHRGFHRTFARSGLGGAAVAGLDLAFNGTSDRTRLNEMESQPWFQNVAPEVTVKLVLLGGFVVLLWVLELMDQLLLRGRLDYFGIQPRRWSGLRGIVFAPLLHGTWRHLMANTMPLLVLGGFVIWRGLDEFAIATLISWVGSGLAVWLLGSPRTLHIGASGLIFGYFGFLLLRGYFEQNLVSLTIAVVVAIVYAPLIWGVLPLRRGVSWQGHLFGFLAGGLTARFLPLLQQGYGAIAPFWHLSR